MTTYWLLEKKPLIIPGQPGVDNNRGDRSRPVNPTSGDKGLPGQSQNTSTGSTNGSQQHEPLRQTSSNSSHVSASNLGTQLQHINSSSSIKSDSMKQPKSPTQSLNSVPRSPVGLRNGPEQHEQAQKVDMQMNMPNMPTPPGSLSRRRNNIDSPRDSRNPLKKFGNTSLTNCISSQGPPSECSSTYMRVDSPELPAVHFRNIKMKDNEDTRQSRAVQNEMFDSLKVGLETKPKDIKPTKMKKKLDSARVSSTYSENDSNTPIIKESNCLQHREEFKQEKRLNNSEIPPPLPKKQKYDFPDYQYAKPHMNNINSNLSHGRPVVPYQVSNPIVPTIKATPLVHTGVAQPLQGPIRAAPLQSPKTVQPTNHFFIQNNAELPSIEEISPEERKKMTNMLKELGKVVNPSQPNKIKNRTHVPVHINGPVTHKHIRQPHEHVPSVPKHTPKQNNDAEEYKEQFVTAVYREPIAATPSPQKSPAPTPPPRTASAQVRGTPRSTPRTTPNSSESQIQNGIEKPLTKLPPRPNNSDRSTQREGDARRISDGSQKSSNSSQSTITPTSGMPIVASIDGRTMSLLPACPDAQTVQEEEARLISLLKRSPSDSSKDRMLNRKSVPQVKRSNSSPKMKFRNILLSKKTDIADVDHHVYGPGQMLSILSDDDESVASHQLSENSSVVLLQPIELKLARPAYVRQISNPDSHHLRSYLENSDFMVSNLDRQISRSSDTISSVPRGPPTPKFPLSTAESTSLTQLLQELANDHPSLDISLQKDVLGDNDFSDDDLDNVSSAVQMNGFGEYDNFINGAKNFHDYGNKSKVQNRMTKNCVIKQTNPANEVKSKPTRHVEKSEAHNPFQVKRRHNYTIPPRHCRSLDYIPSDREDRVSSNQSSACGSPKSKHQMAPHMHSYLHPFFSGRNAMGIQSVSVSSIASSSEMSRSDPALNLEGGSSAYESEYDNYRPGMTSDEDCFIPDPVSDMDIDIFDDVNVDNVTVSDHYSIDLPPIPVFPKKKITEV